MKKLFTILLSLLMIYNTRLCSASNPNAHVPKLQELGRIESSRSRSSSSSSSRSRSRSHSEDGHNVHNSVDQSNYSVRPRGKTYAPRPQF